jgi:hypothetical protein
MENSENQQNIDNNNDNPKPIKKKTIDLTFTDQDKKETWREKGISNSIKGREHGAIFKRWDEESKD